MYIYIYVYSITYKIIYARKEIFELANCIARVRGSLCKYFIPLKETEKLWQNLEKRGRTWTFILERRVSEYIYIPSTNFRKKEEGITYELPTIR